MLWAFTAADPGVAGRKAAEAAGRAAATAEQRRGEANRSIEAVAMCQTAEARRAAERRGSEGSSKVQLE